jgi:hypothetical protein
MQPASLRLRLALGCSLGVCSVLVGLVVGQANDEVARNPAALTTPDQTESFADLFLRNLVGGSAHDAFATIKSAIADQDLANEMDATRDETVRLLDAILPTHGRPIGYELVARRSLGASLLRYECLLKLQKYPIRCTILFYKPQQAWVPVQVVFDQDIKVMFEELGR